MERPREEAAEWSGHDAVPDALRVLKEECLLCFRGPALDLFIPLRSKFRKAGLPSYDAVCAVHLDEYLRWAFDEKAQGTALALVPRPGQAWRVATWPGPSNILQASDPAVWAAVRGFVELLAEAKCELQRAKEAIPVPKATQVVAQDIVQLPDLAPVPKSEWRCQQTDCTKKENLWLNLSDGSILCGIPVGGTGGSGHARQHFLNTGRKFPLAVNLGTINPDRADVFSYSEDAEVTDPKLCQHLAHFGLSMESMSKTEPRLAELQAAELVIPHDQKEVLDGELLWGPDYTGLHNDGDSCYLNSVLQLLALTPEIKRRYVDEAAELFSRETAQHPSEDMEFQTAKIFSALASGIFSPEPPAEDASEEAKAAFRAMDGLRPHLWRCAVCRGSPLFGERSGGDPAEFLAFVLKQLAFPESDPSRCFAFRLVERTEEIASKRVRYSDKEELILSVPLPQDIVENKEAVAAFKERQRLAEEAGKNLAEEDLVRPQVSLTECLVKALEDRPEGGDFRQLTRFLTFPDYLAIQALSNVEVERPSLSLPPILRLEAWKGTKDLKAGEIQLEEEGRPAEQLPEKPVVDGRPLYRLVAVLPHLGSSPHVSHTVAWLRRGTGWVIYDDNECRAVLREPRGQMDATNIACSITQATKPLELAQKSVKVRATKDETDVTFCCFTPSMDDEG